jgi:hypothetical protein
MKLFHIRNRRVAGLFTAVLLLALADGCARVQDWGSSSGSTGSDTVGVASRTRTGELGAAFKTLEVENHFGKVEIVGTTNGPISWSWKLTVHARTDSLATNAVNAASCKPVIDGSRVQLLLALPENSQDLRCESDLEIHLPKTMALLVKNHFGATTIGQIDGDVDVTGQNGSVDLAGIGGKVHGQTSFASLTVQGAGPAWLKCQNGQIEAGNIQGPLQAETSFAALSAQDIGGAATLRNQNGRIEALRVKGNVNVETSFAELVVKGIEGEATLANQNGRIATQDVTGSVKASTSFAGMEIECAGHKVVCHNQNGAIDLRATSPELASIDAETAFGAMEVHLSAGLKPAIQARTSFGNVESDFPVLMKPAGENPFADVEAGTPQIKLLNHNGHIHIVREKITAAR